MTKITSRILGDVEIEEVQRIRFNGTLFGFETYNEFALLDFPGENLFKLLQSIEDPNLAFVVIQPSLVFPDYILDIHEEDINSLNLTKPEEELVVFAIVTIPEIMNDMTANLQGPVLVNRVTGEGRQCIAMNEGYTTRHRIIQDARSEAVV